MGVSLFEGNGSVKYICTGTIFYLAVQTDGKQHEEEEDGPQWRDGEFGHSLGVGHEGEPRPYKFTGSQNHI